MPIDVDMVTEGVEAVITTGMPLETVVNVGIEDLEDTIGQGVKMMVEDMTTPSGGGFWP